NYHVGAGDVGQQRPGGASGVMAELAVANGHGAVGKNSAAAVVVIGLAVLDEGVVQAERAVIDNGAAIGARAIELVEHDIAQRQRDATVHNKQARGKPAGEGDNAAATDG